MWRGSKKFSLDWNEINNGLEEISEITCATIEQKGREMQ